MILTAWQCLSQCKRVPWKGKFLLDCGWFIRFPGKENNNLFNGVHKNMSYFSVTLVLVALMVQLLIVLCFMKSAEGNWMQGNKEFISRLCSNYLTLNSTNEKICLQLKANLHLAKWMSSLWSNLEFNIGTGISEKDTWYFEQSGEQFYLAKQYTVKL